MALAVLEALVASAAAASLWRISSSSLVISLVALSVVASEALVAAEVVSHVRAVVAIFVLLLSYRSRRLRRA